MQSGERELSFRLHAVRTEHRRTECARTFRGDGEHRRLADSGFAADNERPATVGDLIDNPRQLR